MSFRSFSVSFRSFSVSFRSLSVLFGAYSYPILRGSFRLWEAMAEEGISLSCSREGADWAIQVCESGVRGVERVLDEDVVEAGSVNAFKRKLDHHLRNVRGYF